MSISPLENLTPIGEEIVKNALITDSFQNVVTEKNLLGETYILADSISMKILVKVVAAQQPDLPTVYSNESKSAIIAKAIQHDRVGYVAYLVVDENAALAGEITWQKLH